MFYGNISYIKEASSNELPKGTLGGDLKNATISLNSKDIFTPKLKSAITSVWNKKIKSMATEYIEQMYSSWYNKDNDLSLDQVKKMASVDVIDISKSKDEYDIEYWVGGGKKYKEFFSDHAIIAEVTLDKDCKLKEVGKIYLAG